jgi:hypothetical protein
MKIPLHLVIALLISAVTATAQEKKTAEPAKPGAPGKPAEPAKPTDPAKPAEPTADAKVYAPTDLATLKPLKGQKITLEGKIDNAGANRAETIRYLNFTKNFRESVSLVFFITGGGGAFTKEKLAEFVGKKVRVNGTLSEYNGNLQIRVTALDQLKVQDTP